MSSTSFAHLRSIEADCLTPRGVARTSSGQEFTSKVYKRKPRQLSSLDELGLSGRDIRSMATGYRGMSYPFIQP